MNQAEQEPSDANSTLFRQRLSECELFRLKTPGGAHYNDGHALNGTLFRSNHQELLALLTQLEFDFRLYDHKPVQQERSFGSSSKNCDPITINGKIRWLEWSEASDCVGIKARVSVLPRDGCVQINMNSLSPYSVCLTDIDRAKQLELELQKRSIPFGKPVDAELALDMRSTLIKRYFISDAHLEIMYSRYLTVSRFQKQALKDFSLSTGQDPRQQRAADFWQAEVLPCWDTAQRDLLAAWQAASRSSWRLMTAFTADLNRPFDDLGYLAPAMVAWWSDEESRADYVEYEQLIARTGANIYKTLTGLWTAEDILNPAITGRVPDMEDLLCHMEVGDSVKYNFYLQGTHPDE